jgi:hypothetical protein
MRKIQRIYFDNEGCFYVVTSDTQDTSFKLYVGYPPLLLEACQTKPAEITEHTVSLFTTRGTLDCYPRHAGVQPSWTSSDNLSPELIVSGHHAGFELNEGSGQLTLTQKK